MDRFFSLLGKFAVVLIIVGVLVTGGYYLGTGKLPFSQNPAPGAVTTIAVPRPPTPTLMDERPLTATPSPTIAVGQPVTGGGLPGLSFNAYTLMVPASWTVKKETSAGVSEKITITRGAYSMNIYQAATGGSQCLYPGDPPAEMSSSFGPFVTIHDGSGSEFRRGTPAGSASGFTVCQKGASGFGLPTSYGHITYGTPSSPDPAILQEIDAIFATLKKS